MLNKASTGSKMCFIKCVVYALKIQSENDKSDLNFTIGSDCISAVLKKRSAMCSVIRNFKYRFIPALNTFSSDSDFDALYPDSVQKHSFIHWTPIEILETALDWLQLESSSHVLDIGSGAGKFCIVAGSRSKARFTGVEMREDLVKVANETLAKIGMGNVEFVQADITTIDFKEYTHFYYYNPFCEYIAEFDRIDDTITYDPETFRKLEDYVIDQFEQLPVNTRVVTYCSESFPFPASYELKDMLYDGKLALWVKTKP